MANIKIITDSASDIPKSIEQALQIQILPFSITADGKAYQERVDFTAREFYEILHRSTRIPVTAHIPHFQFFELFKTAFAEGVTDVIYTAINAKGSNTFSAANMGRELFYTEYPQAKDAMRIYVLDAKNYTLAYGYPVIEAARKARRGASAEEIVAYLQDWYDSVEIYFAPYTLDFAKKSGRIGCAAAFVGEMIGLRPIISIIDGEMTIVEKVRGDKSIIPALIKHAVRHRVPQTPYCIVHGENTDTAELLKAEAIKKLGAPPEHFEEIGAAISINAGPNVSGIIVKGNKRR